MGQQWHRSRAVPLADRHRGDEFGNVYVADQFDHKIKKFTTDGEFVTDWGGEGSGNGQFSHPTGVAVDSFGNVYATDHNNRIQKFTSDGEFITKFGSFGTGNGQQLISDGKVFHPAIDKFFYGIPDYVV